MFRTRGRRRLARVAVATAVALAATFVTNGVAAADAIDDVCETADVSGAEICPPVRAVADALVAFVPTPADLDLGFTLDSLTQLAAACAGGGDPYCDAAIAALDAGLAPFDDCVPVSQSRAAADDCVELALALADASVAIANATVTCVTSRQPVCDAVLDVVEAAAGVASVCAWEGMAVLLPPDVVTDPPAGASIGCAEFVAALRDFGEFAAATTLRCVAEDVAACRTALDTARFAIATVGACANGAGVGLDGVNVGEASDPGCEAAVETVDGALARLEFFLAQCVARTNPTCDTALTTAEQVVDAVNACLEEGTATVGGTDIDCGAAVAAVLAIVGQLGEIIEACASNPVSCTGLGPVIAAVGALVDECTGAATGGADSDETDVDCGAVFTAARDALDEVNALLDRCVTQREPLCDTAFTTIGQVVDAVTACAEEGTVPLGGTDVDCGAPRDALLAIVAQLGAIVDACSADPVGCTGTGPAIAMIGALVAECTGGPDDDNTTVDCGALVQAAVDAVNGLVVLVTRCASRTEPVCDGAVTLVEEAVTAATECATGGTATLAGTDVDCGALVATVTALVAEIAATVTACAAEVVNCLAVGPVLTTVTAFLASCTGSVNPALEGDPRPEGSLDCSAVMFPVAQLVIEYAGLVNACAAGEEPCVGLPYQAGVMVYAVGGCASSLTVPTPGGLTPAEPGGCALVTAEAARLLGAVSSDVAGCSGAGDSSCDQLLADLTDAVSAVGACATAVTGAGLDGATDAAASTCSTLGDLAAFIGTVGAAVRSCPSGLTAECSAALDELRRQICVTQTSVCPVANEPPAVEPGGDVVTEVTDIADGFGDVTPGAYEPPPPPRVKGNCGSNNYWVDVHTTKRYGGAFAYLKTFNPSMPNLRDFSLSHIHIKNKNTSATLKPYVEIGWHKGQQGHNPYYSSVHYFYEMDDASSSGRLSVTLADYPDANSTRLYQIVKVGRTSSTKWRWRLYAANLSTPRATIDIQDLPLGRVAIGGELSAGSNYNTQMRSHTVTAAQLWDGNGKVNNWTPTYMKQVGDVTSVCDGYADFTIKINKAYSDVNIYGYLKDSE